MNPAENATGRPARNRTAPGVEIFKKSFSRPGPAGIFSSGETMMMSFPGGRPDGDLVRLALRDDPRAFEALVLRWQRRASAIVRAGGTPPDAVEDVVQEAFLRAFRALPGLRAPERFGPWLL